MISGRKIAILIPSLGMGGAEKVVVQLANGLGRAGWAVSVVVMEDGGPLHSELEDHVAVIDLNAPSYRRAVISLARFYDREQPAVVLATLYATNVAALAARMLSRHKPKVVAGAHNSLRYKIVRPDNFKDRHLLGPLSRFFLPKADAVAAVSEGVAKELRAMVPLDPARVHVIYNPVVAPDLETKVAEPVDHEWLAPGRRFKTLINVGRFVPQKGHDILINAFAQARKQQDIRLILLGDGPLLEESRLLARKLSVDDHVDFLGRQENPFKYMSRADLFVLSSRWEGLGNVIIEAMACGCPVVATDCDFGPREILDGETYGLLAEVDNPESLACAIEAAIEPPPTSLRNDRAALRKRAQSFTVDVAVQDYQGLFERLLTMKKAAD